MPQLKDVQKLGQSIWLDFIQRGLIISGKLAQLVSDGLRGITSNPTIFHNAIAQSHDYDDAIQEILKSDPGADAKDILRSAKQLGLDVELILLTHRHPDHVGCGNPSPSHRPYPRLPPHPV